jgi:hypothetical protein
MRAAFSSRRVRNQRPAIEPFVGAADIFMLGISAPSIETDAATRRYSAWRRRAFPATANEPAARQLEAHQPSGNGINGQTIMRLSLAGLATPGRGTGMAGGSDTTASRKRLHCNCMIDQPTQ